MAHPALLFHFTTVGLVPQAVDTGSPIYKPVDMCNMTIRGQATLIAKALKAHQDTKEVVQVVSHTSELFAYVARYVTDAQCEGLLVAVKHTVPTYDIETFAFDVVRFVSEHLTEV